MIPGAVGFQCPECVRAGQKETRQIQLPHGGERSANPKVTSIVLIAVNAVVFVAIQLVGVANYWLTDLLALTPANHCQPMADGSFFTNHAYCTLQGLEWGYGVASQPWQVITSGFTHVEAMHILFNMLVLFMLGPNLEMILGRARFLAIYFIALIGGSAAVMVAAEPYAQTLGASGAIYGLLGAYVIAAIRHRGNIRSILMWVGLNLAFSFIFPNVSWQAHIGGLLFGAAAAAIVMWVPRKKEALQWGLLGALLAVLLLVIAVRAVALA